MAKTWSASGRAVGAGRRDIERAIFVAKKLLGGDEPTDESWKRYQSFLFDQLFEAMLKAATSGSRSAARAAGIEVSLDAATRQKIMRLASEQAKLITNNSRKAYLESSKRLARMGLEATERARVLRLIGGLNRSQASGLLTNLESRLKSGKRFGGAMRGLGDIAEEYLESRASRIALMQGARSATLGANSIVELIGESTKTWVALDGACPVCEELSGRTIPADAEFSHPENGQPIYGHDVHMNCRCSVEYEFGSIESLLGPAERAS